jgi:hypothetical protein
MTADLIQLLKSCGQLVEPNLEQLAADYSLGLVDISAETLEDDSGEVAGREDGGY